MREKLLTALREVARSTSPNMPDAAMVAERAGVSVAEVKEHLGPQENFQALLSWQNPAHETRERIIQSAMHVFGQKGFQKASLDEVAADAGLTKGAIYWHFKSKNDLFFAMLDHRFQQDTGPLRGDIDLLISQRKNPDQAMLQIFSAGLYRLTSDPGWSRLFLECLSLGRQEQVRERLATFYEQVWAMSSGLTCELQANELLNKSIDPEAAAIFWSALFDGLILAWLIKGDELQFPDLLPRIFSMLWQGISPHSPAHSNSTED